MDVVTMETASTIEPELLFQQLASARDVVVIDTRARDKCERVGWIPGSRRFPLSQLRGRMTELASLRAVPIVVVSSRGTSARAAAAALTLSGFGDVSVLRGGIHEWIALGLPIEHGSTPPPSCV